MSATLRLSRFALAFIGCFSSAISASAACTSTKCSPDLLRTSEPDVNVIVQYSSVPGNAEKSMLAGQGTVFGQLPFLKAMTAKVATTNLDAIASLPNVVAISVDHKLAAKQFGVVAQPIGSSPEYTAEPINAPWAWSNNYTGQGIGIAIVDSGITPSADLTVAPGLKLSVPSALSSDQKNSVASAAAAARATTLPAASTVATSAGVGRVIFSYNFTNSDPTDTTDAYGHGTHVAGLIAGNGASSTGMLYSRTFKGIAPNANLINLKVLDAAGQGSDSSVIAAIQTAILLKDVYNIRIINLSLGRPIYETYTTDPLCQAVEQAWKAGIAVVVAAGNDGRDLALNREGYGTIEAPGNDPYALSVGAANTVNTAAAGDDVMASYSSKGPSFIDLVAKPDLVAPGNLVTSLLAPESTLQRDNPSFNTPYSWYVNQGSAVASITYFPLSGTSMATAVVSGAMADLVQAYPGLTPDQLKALLMASANKTVIPQTNVVTDPNSSTSFTAHNDVFTKGAGYLDLQAAITSASAYSSSLPSTGFALSPVASYNSSDGTVSLLADPNALWGKGATSSTAFFLSESGVYGSTSFVAGGVAVLWGSTALWDFNDSGAFTALWGRNSLWSQGSPEAETALWGRSDDSSSSASTGSTALWGRNTNSGSTALWGRNTDSGSTALWGR